MGNRMSHTGEGNAYNHLDNVEIPPEPYGSNLPRLRGGGLSSHLYGLDDTAVPAAPASFAFSNLSPQGVGGGTQHKFSEVPATTFYAAPGGDRQHGPLPSRCAPAPAPFDFNDQQQPNPWQQATSQPQRPRTPQPQHEREVVPEVRRFASCRYDADLQAYMGARRISVGFLTEIDQFLKGHPEIATCTEGRVTLHHINALPPLEAFKYFLKGYTRPARYLDGIIRTDNFHLPLGYPYQPLSTKTDPELVEFFDGFEYRHDLIDRIDEEVRGAMRELAYGGMIPLALRKLVCYAIWGNPVDAYKWFEYSYQNDYMPHRYLPEHVVLGHVPKPSGYTEPRPLTDSSSKKHRDVRARMARANDQGVDVLDVLIAEYRFALVRRAHRRREIDKLVLKAKQRLEHERQHPTGVDIVDFIMDDAVSRQGTNRPSVPRRTNRRNRKVFNPGSQTFSFNRINIYGGIPTFTRVNERENHRFLLAQAADLRAAKSTLVRLYTKEQHALKKRGLNTRESITQNVRSCRAGAERRYVNCLIRYCRDAGRMTSAQANDLQKHFTRGKMGDSSVPNSSYLLGMYPHELY